MMPNWVRACSRDEIEEEDVLRLDVNDRTFAIYRGSDDDFFASDGLCTHEDAHLCDGLVMDYVIECPKHNGRFDIRTGKGLGAPIEKDLRTYPVKLEGDDVYIDLLPG